MRDIAAAPVESVEGRRLRRPVVNRPRKTADARPGPRRPAVEPAPLPIPLPHVTRAVRTGGPHPGDQPLDEPEFRTGSDAVSNGEGTFVAGRARGDFVNSVERANICTESAQTSHAFGAAAPSYREMRRGSDDSGARVCASQVLTSLPRRLRSPSLAIGNVSRPRRTHSRNHRPKEEPMDIPPFRKTLPITSLCCVLFLGPFPVEAQWLSCDHWNTPRFFKRAGISLVSKCIDTHGVNVRDEWGNSPLHHALKGRHAPNIIAIVNAGAQVNSVNDLGETSMHFAANYSLTTDTIDLLLLNGGNVSLQDDFGRTPLHIAVEFNNTPSVVRRLLAEGAQINIQDERGFTPLHRAAENNSTVDDETIAVLLQAGANVNITNDRGKTPLHLAAENTYGFAELIALIQAGSDVNAREEQGATPLHLAASSGPRRDESIVALSAAGANVNSQDDLGRTPLHEAASAGSAKEPDVHALLKAGANLDSVDDDDFTPLHMASGGRNGYAVPTNALVLVHAGANVNVVNERGHTPLHYAALFSESEELLKQLLDAGADPSAKDHDGMTPWDYALRRDEPLKDPTVSRQLEQGRSQ